MLVDSQTESKDGHCRVEVGRTNSLATSVIISYYYVATIYAKQVL